MDKHVVLTSGRSGSNHLVAAMNQHPNLCNFGEVLGPWTLPSRLWKPFAALGASKAQLLDTVYHSAAVFYAAQSMSFASRKRKGLETHFRKRSQIFSLGVKDFFMHLRDNSALQWFIDCPNLAIIHLQRKDLLARGLSVIRLQQSGRAVALAGEQRRTETLYVPIEDLMEALDALVQETEEESAFLEQLQHHRRLSITHEEHLSCWEKTSKTLSMVQDFLNVPEQLIQDTGHRSSVRGRAIESIENREEIEAALEQSAHAHLLEFHLSQDPK